MHYMTVVSLEKSDEPYFLVRLSALWELVKLRLAVSLRETGVHRETISYQNTTDKRMMSIKKK